VTTRARGRWLSRIASASQLGWKNCQLLCPAAQGRAFSQG
jgi:hypothetical protein